MVVACGTNGGEEKCSQCLVVKLEGKKPLVSSRRLVVGCFDHGTEPSKMQGTSSVVQELSASQDGSCSIALTMLLVSI